MMANEFDIPEIGINVRSDGKLDYADLIVDGKKKLETRNTDSLRPYVGKRVSIVKTGKGRAYAIGAVTIGEPIKADEEKFRKLENEHLVSAGSKFDIQVGSTKFLYPMLNPTRYERPREVGHGIVSRKVFVNQPVLEYARWLKESVNSVKIYDADALNKMAIIEGERWRQKQENNKNDSYGFYAYLKAWKVIENEGMVGEASPYEAISMDLVPGVKRGDGAIYGDGGYNRYYVGRDGTIKFDYNLAREEKSKLAQELGFSPG